MARPLGLPAIAAVAFFVACALFISAWPQTLTPRDWPDQQQARDGAATATAISPNLDKETGRGRSRPVAELLTLPTPPAPPRAPPATSIASIPVPTPIEVKTECDWRPETIAGSCVGVTKPTKHSRPAKTAQECER